MSFDEKNRFASFHSSLILGDQPSCLQFQHQCTLKLNISAKLNIFCDCKLFPLGPGGCRSLHHRPHHQDGRDRASHEALVAGARPEPDVGQDQTPEETSVLQIDSVHYTEPRRG